MLEVGDVVLDVRHGVQIHPTQQPSKKAGDPSSRTVRESISNESDIAIDSVERNIRMMVGTSQEKNGKKIQEKKWEHGREGRAGGTFQ